MRSHSMFDLITFSYTSLVLCIMAIALWIVSRIKNDVGIVDSFWSLMILVAGLCFVYFNGNMLSERNILVLILLSIWAIRLSAHITWRNWGQEEDNRYQTIRQNNQPNFEFKSLYIVFLLQALLALIVALPLMSIFNSDTQVNSLDYIAFALWFFGMFFETIADQQLAHFKANKENQGKSNEHGSLAIFKTP